MALGTALHLYKVTVEPRYKYEKKPKPFYVVQRSKEAAIEYVQNNLREGFKAKSATYLGDQLAEYMYKAP